MEFGPFLNGQPSFSSGLTITEAPGTSLNSSSSKINGVNVPGFIDSAKGNFSAEEILEKYAESGDEAWLEKWVDNQLLKEREQSARDFEENMSNTSFSRLIADIENAGFNPWLALQSNMQTTSTPSSSGAGISSFNVSDWKNSKQNADSTSLLKVVAIGGVLLKLMSMLI